ncbi:WXG100 family type VII secretion target [Streptomyces sp. XM4193]|uniref:ESAT-6-like protein n=1 Tax=Streptomyces tardus TaxID=2780544 RepID=A0A949NB70_9ACTN|nr:MULTISPECIES: WXG100 family type VII secretion target [Streptomyces]MBU7600558.1 WXG100 family type VII secretion target [Streptomyces tardus]MCK1797199.1 WXG100 family type VII secretion target [Streptomyces sp. XM4193]
MASDPSQLVVNYGSLEKAAADIESAAKRLRGDLERVQQEVKKVAQTWEGEAQSAYMRVHVTWDQRADSMERTLMQIASKVRQASGEYQASDRKAAGRFDI